MSGWFIVLSLAASTLLCLRRRPRALVVFAVMMIIAVWASGSGWLTALALEGLQRHPRLETVVWGRRNVIVLLGWEITRWPDGPVRVGVRGVARVHEAARLYRQCRSSDAEACVVLASSGDPTHLGRAEADAMAEALLELGLPESDVRRESRSNNTFQNAQFSAPMIKDGHFDRVVLVSSGFHLARAQLYFAYFLNVPTLAAPADHLDAVGTYWPHAINMSHFDLAWTEYVGIVRFYVYNALGWNPPPHATKL